MWVSDLPLSWPRYCALFATRLVVLACLRTVGQVTRNPRKNLLVSDTLAWLFFFGYHYLWATLATPTNPYMAYEEQVVFRAWIACNVMWYIHRRTLYSRLIPDKRQLIGVLVVTYVAAVACYMLALPPYVFTGYGVLTHAIVLGVRATDTTAK